MSADYQLHGSVAVITLDNPPVNGLGLATRTALVAGIGQAEADPAVTAIVIAGAGKVFSGGADIREFNSPSALAEPNLHTLIALAEGASKPVVAAIHGVCMGGGLELALGCHYRLAASGAQIALPEVKLGLLPGAGGTQRLPRLLGLQAALDMILTGAPVLSDKLAGTALFDRVVDAGVDLLPAAVAFAESVAAARPLPKVRERAAAYPDAARLLAAARARVDATAGPFPAPRACVEAVAASVTADSFEAGLRFERESFMHLAATPQSQALRHAFFAGRAAGKVPGLAPDARPRPSASAAVVGGGAMGAGIAMSFANAGIPVTILEMNQQALAKALADIGQLYDSSVAKGKLTADRSRQRMALIKGTLSYDAVAQADIVVEAVFEDMDVKELVFRELGQLMKPGAILATSTATLDVNRIAAFTGRAQDVIGLHFSSPAREMTLLEIVRGAQTGDDVLVTALALAKQLKKTGVVSGVCEGFIGKRMHGQYLRQAHLLLEQGVLPAQIERAIEAFGFATGPFRMAESASSATAVARRGIDDAEIVERLVYALVNEGAKILEEGIALRASDIDVVFLSAYGFPSHRGGPMWYADTVGLPAVLAKIEAFARGWQGQMWTPAPLLVQLAAHGAFNA